MSSAQTSWIRKPRISIRTSRASPSAEHQPTCRRYVADHVPWVTRVLRLLDLPVDCLRLLMMTLGFILEFLEFLQGLVSDLVRLQLGLKLLLNTLLPESPFELSCNTC